MKYIQVKIGSWRATYLVPADKDSAALLVALGSAISVSETTKGGIVTYKKADDQQIELSFVSDPRFEDTTPVENELLAKLQAAESRWLEYYQKEQAATKRATEAEKKLKEIQDKVGSVLPSVSSVPDLKQGESDF
jgi:hypothetical protein